MTNLKPCPFCGEIPHLDKHEIFCDCGAKMWLDAFRYEVKYDGLFPTYIEARQMMIEAWNRRAGDE